MDPPNITISEGGGKRHKTSSSPPTSVELDRSTAGSNEAVLDGTCTADGFTALTNRGDVNEKGTSDEMDWAEFGQEEVHDQQNYADKLDIFPIDILLW